MPLWRTATWMLAALITAGCSKTQPPVAPAKTDAHTANTTSASMSHPPTAASGGSWIGAPMRGNSTEGLRNYLRNVKEITPKKFKAEWSPVTVALDRDATLRSLRSVSRDGAVIGLASDDPAVAKLKPGSILWVWDIAVRKVVSLETLGDVTLVNTRSVALNEAIPNAQIEFETPVDLSAYYRYKRIIPVSNDPAKTGALRWRKRGSDGGGFLYAGLNTGKTEEGDVPPGKTGDPGSSDDSWYDEGMSENGFNGEKNGWQYSIGYKVRPGGITLELQARKGEEEAGGGESPGDAVEDKELADKYKEIETEEKEIKELVAKTEEQLAKEREGLKEVDSEYQDKMEQLKQQIANRNNPSYTGPRPPRPTTTGGTPLSDKTELQQLQNEWDHKREIESKKLAEAQKILDEAHENKEKTEARKRALETAKKVAKALWDIVSDNVVARIRARVDLDGFAIGENLVFKNGDIDAVSTHFKNLNGKIQAQLIGRLGHTGVENIKIPVMQVPIAFNVPIPVGGIPFVVQLGADFTLTLSLSGQHATLTVDGQTAFRGDSGFDYKESKASYSTEFKGDEPTISDYKGFSLGVSAVVLGVQVPRIGFGLGLLGVSSVAYVDVVNVITMTNGAAVGGLGPPCKRISYAAVGHVGIETDVIPLPFGVNEKVAEKLSPKKEIFKLERQVLDPPIKMCEVK